MSHPAPPRDRVTEQSVREAALTLFAQRGFHGTALRDIANEVGIRTGYPHRTRTRPGNR
jgi:AcrR family transcriptional regulator